jgi:predicted CXXCH cytochrome family protein
MKEIIAGFLFLGVFAGVAFAADMKDPMEFPASNGKVTFGHANHVGEVQGDCGRCHEGTPGKIKGFGKDVAHRICLPCHEGAGLFPGQPVCNDCHNK